jgi:hypothetical protein
MPQCGAMRRDWAGSLYKLLSVPVACAAGFLALTKLTPALFLLVVVWGAYIFGGSDGAEGATSTLLAITAWGLAGFAGVASWALLTVQFWIGGTPKLKTAHWGWWISLSLGVIAAAPLVVPFFSEPKPYMVADSISLCALIVLAPYLVYLRLRKSLALPPPLPNLKERTLKEFMDRMN